MLTANLLHTFGQSYSYYSYQTSTTTSSGPGVAFWIGYFGFIGLIILTVVISAWRIFTKAGQAGWKALIPIYSGYVILKIVHRPGWWILLYFIPLVNVVVGVIVAIDLAKAFDRGVGLAVLMVLLPFIGYPILAFSKSTYILGDAAKHITDQNTPMTNPMPPVQM